MLLLCRQAQQKWDLATVCLDHMRLAVKGLMPLSSSVSVHYPGMAVMLQLLGALPARTSTAEQAPIILWNEVTGFVGWPPCRSTFAVIPYTSAGALILSRAIPWSLHRCPVSLTRITQQRHGFR